MTEGQVLSARLHPADVVDRGDRKSPDYFLDWAFDEVKRIAAKYGIHSLVARTTIDLDMQQAAEESLEFHLRQYGKDYRVTEGAIVVLENNGARARHRRRPRLWRKPVQPRHQGAAPDRLVVQALCLCGGDGERLHARHRRFRTGRSAGAAGRRKNYGRGYAGRVTLTTALAKSINTVPVRLAKDYLSIPPIKAMADRDGRRIAARATTRPWCSARRA